MIQQAIYTSSQSAKRGGYQLVTVSTGVNNEETRELSRWGPAHDSLFDHALRLGSVNFHPVSGSAFCISKTMAMGSEYSQRSGPRIHTHQFVVPAQTMQRFAWDPFRIVDALVVARHLGESENIPQHLPTIRLVGGAVACDVNAVRRLLDAVGAERLCNLLSITLANEQVGVRTSVRSEHLLRAIFSLLPVQVRRQVSFTTGLRPSARRPFRVHVLPENEKQARQEARRVRMLVFDVHGRHSMHSSNPWVDLLRCALASPNDLPFLLRIAAECEADDLPKIAAHVTARAG